MEKFKRYHFKKPKIIAKNRQMTLHELERDAISVFHPTYYDPYFIANIKKPLVITIHDMIYERFPDFFSSEEEAAYHKCLHIERADKIIAVSHNTKEDVLKYYPSVAQKIDVVYHGIDSSTPLRYESIPNLPAQYILYVGGRFGYKNFSLLVEAFAHISQRYKGLKLVLAGRPLGRAEEELFYRNRIGESIIHISATDRQLNTRYKHVLFFIYPSTYEGFGLPILEAYRNECPALLSDMSCFPEVAGRPAAFFETNAMDSLIEQIDLLFTDSAYRENLVRLGKDKIKEYTLKRCVEETIAVYKSL